MVRASPTKTASDGHFNGNSQIVRDIFSLDGWKQWCALFDTSQKRARWVACNPESKASRRDPDSRNHAEAIVRPGNGTV